MKFQKIVFIVVAMSLNMQAAELRAPSFKEKVENLKPFLKDGSKCLAYAAAAGVSGAATVLSFALTRDCIRLPVDNRESSNCYVAAGTVTTLATVGSAQLTWYFIQNSFCVARDRVQKMLGKKAEDKN